MVLAGEITTNATFDYEQIARRAIREIGYTDPTEQFNADGVKVMMLISKQSGEINAGRRDATDDRGAGRRRPGHHVRLRHRRERRS